jgi:hypothetical protein
MLDNFIYENHLGQRFSGLENGVYLNIGELRDYTWAHETINNRISRFYRKTTNRKIPLYVVGKTNAQAAEAMNRLFEITEADIAENIPGSVFVGDYYTRGFVTTSKKTRYLDNRKICKIDLTLTSDDPNWYKNTTYAFYTNATTPKAKKSGTVITLNGAPEAPLRGLTVYGKTTQDGTPSPDMPLELLSAGGSGNVTVSVGKSFEDTNAKTAKISVGYGLHGIPVDSGGNYTDENGQQWIADTIEYDADAGTAKIVRRVGVINESSQFGTIKKNGDEATWRVMMSGVSAPNAAYPNSMCTKYNVVKKYSDVNATNNSIALARSELLLIRDDSLTTNNDVLAMLTGGDFELIYPLATPTETEISTTLFYALKTINPVTKIYNDASAYMDVVYSTVASSSGASIGGMDNSFDHPYEYAVRMNGRSIVCDSFSGSAFRLLIYGECINPTVNIGGHAYTVNGTVGNGETLLIDSMAKTITLKTAYGNTVNYFDKRSRDSYIFEPIPSGKNAVTWSGDFGFELTVIEKRSEPKWT